MITSQSSRASRSPSSSHVSGQTQTPSLIRTADQADLQSTPEKPAKSIKRRATQACQRCRTRKMKCDVARLGTPCTHCRVDEEECTVPESRRRKKPASDIPVGSSSTNVPRSLGDPVHSEGVLHEHRHNSDAQAPANGFPATMTRTESAGTSAINQAPPGQNASNISSGTTALPTYIKALPDKFGDDDIAFLRSKGALTIPHPELRCELLRSYAEFFHPFMPLLDWHDFMSNLDDNGPKHSVSLLLFQAIMFSGVANVDMSFLRAAGFDCRRTARSIFFNRVHTLYNLDYEDDDISLLQSLLLMTYWRAEQTATKETHHWIEIAVSRARKIGIDRSPEETATTTPKQQRLYRRIWWSLYMRDAQIALGTPGPTLIQNADFTVAMLKLSDFEPFASDTSSLPADCEVVRDQAQQRQLAIMCIEMTRLCMLLSHTLSVYYGAANTNGSRRTAALIFGDAYRLKNDHVLLTAEKLNDWKEGLSERSHYAKPTPEDINSSSACLVLHRSWLHMMYWATVSCLHRGCVSEKSWIGLPKDCQEQRIYLSRSAAKEAGSRMTDIASSLYSLNMIRLLPSASITCMLPAITSKLSVILSKQRRVLNQSLQDFVRCIEVLDSIREMYAAADYATTFLQSAIESAEFGPMSSTSVHNVRSINNDVITTDAQNAPAADLQRLPTRSASHASQVSQQAVEETDAPANLQRNYSLHPTSEQASGSGMPAVHAPVAPMRVMYAAPVEHQPAQQHQPGQQQLQQASQARLVNGGQMTPGMVPYANDSLVDQMTNYQIGLSSTHPIREGEGRPPDLQDYNGYVQMQGISASYPVHTGWLPLHPDGEPEHYVELSENQARGFG